MAHPAARTQPVALALSVLLLCPAWAWGAPAAEKPVAKAPAKNKVTVSADGTIKMSASKEIIRTVEKSNCGTWIDPLRGFVDRCDEKETLVESAQAEDDDTALEVVEFDPADGAETERFDVVVYPEFAPIDLTQDLEAVVESVVESVAPVAETVNTVTTQVAESTDSLRSLIQRLDAEIAENVKRYGPKSAQTEVVAARPGSPQAVIFQALALGAPKAEAAPEKPAPQAKAEKKPPSQTRAVKVSRIMPLARQVTSIQPEPVTDPSRQEWPKNPVGKVTQGFVGVFQWLFK